MRSPAALPFLASIAFITAIGATPAPGATQDGSPSERARRQAAADEDHGRHLFLRDCSGCHGPDADGTFRGPTLERAGTASVDFMLTTGRMPIDDRGEPIARGEPMYSQEEIDAIVGYLDGLIGGPAIPEVRPEEGDLSEGGRRYRVLCAPCHGATGIGTGLAYVNPAPRVLGVTPLQAAEAMLIGPTTMPVFHLPEKEVNSIVRYVDTLDDIDSPGGMPLWGLGPVAEGAAAWVFGAGLLVLVARRIGRS